MRRVGGTDGHPAHTPPPCTSAACSACTLGADHPGARAAVRLHAARWCAQYSRAHQFTRPPASIHRQAGDPASRAKGELSHGANGGQARRASVPQQHVCCWHLNGQGTQLDSPFHGKPQGRGDKLRAVSTSDECGGLLSGCVRPTHSCCAAGARQILTNTFASPHKQS